jgi:hypothetical protein
MPSPQRTINDLEASDCRSYVLKSVNLTVPFRYLHDCSDCFRLEQKLPGGSFTHWKTPPFHGARPKQPFINKLKYCNLGFNFASFIHFLNEIQPQYCNRQGLGCTLNNRIYDSATLSLLHHYRFHQIKEQFYRSYQLLLEKLH